MHQQKIDEELARLQSEGGKEESSKQIFKVSDFHIGLQIGAGAYAVVKRSVHR